MGDGVSVYFFEVKDEVQLGDVLEAAIERLDEDLHAWRVSDGGATGGTRGRERRTHLDEV